MKRIFASAVAAILSTSVLAQATPSPVERIGEPRWDGQRLPFSSAVRVGDILFMSGRIGDRPDGTLPNGIEAQARQTMENIGDVLKSQGLAWGNVFKCTVMLDNIGEWAAFNRVYVTYFPDGKSPPAAHSARTVLLTAR